MSGLIGAGKNRERGFFVAFWDDPDEDPRPRIMKTPTGGDALLFDRDEGIGMLQMLSETLGVYITIEDAESGEALFG